MRSKAPKQQAECLKSDTLPPSAPSLLFLTGLRQRGLLGDNQGRESMSFIFQVPHSFNPTLTPPPSFPSQHQADTSRLTLSCTSKPQQSLTFHPSADTNHLSRWALTSLTTGEGPHHPCLHFPTSYPNWQAVFFYFAMQSRVLLCAFLVFEHTTKHMCHTQAARNVFSHQQPSSGKKKHCNALVIEVRVNAITNLFQRFI